MIEKASMCINLRLNEARTCKILSILIANGMIKNASKSKRAINIDDSECSVVDYDSRYVSICCCMIFAKGKYCQSPDVYEAAGCSNEYYSSVRKAVVKIMQIDSSKQFPVDPLPNIDSSRVSTSVWNTVILIRLDFILLFVYSYFFAFCR